MQLVGGTDADAHVAASGYEHRWNAHVIADNQSAAAVGEVSCVVRISAGEKTFNHRGRVLRVKIRRVVQRDNGASAGEILIAGEGISSGLPSIVAPPSE